MIPQEEAQTPVGRIEMGLYGSTVPKVRFVNATDMLYKRNVSFPSLKVVVEMFHRRAVALSCLEYQLAVNHI